MLSTKFIDRVVKEKVVINGAYEFRAIMPEGRKLHWGIYRRKRGDAYARIKPVAYYDEEEEKWQPFSKRSVECMTGYRDWPTDDPKVIDEEEELWNRMLKEYDENHGNF